MWSSSRKLIQLKTTTEHTEHTEPTRLRFLGDLGDLGGVPTNRRAAAMIALHGTCGWFIPPAPQPAGLGTQLEERRSVVTRAHGSDNYA